MKYIKVFLLTTISVLIFIGCSDKAPKNIIVMISDGCGYNQIDAASLYEHGKTGVQVYEKFPVIYGMSTFSINGNLYNVDSAWSKFDYVKRKPTDSAAAATALACGTKTKNGYIGMDSAKVSMGNVIERLEHFGKSTGVITSVQLNHATPAGYVAHNESRGNYEQIANEMFRTSKLEVIMGCGHPYYDNDGKQSGDSLYKYVGGQDTWNDLLAGKAGNDCDSDGVQDNWKLIQKKSEFLSLAKGETPKRLLGIVPVYSTLQANRSGDSLALPFEVPFIETVPKLHEMVQAALNVLDADPDGLFLMVEGGAIDWACHDNNASRLIEEEIDFNRAVEAVVDWIEKNSSWDETLLIVTADHETGYLTGPGSNDSTLTKFEKIDDMWKPLQNRGKAHLPGMQWNSGHHTNQLVPLFAKGAKARKFSEYIVGTDPVRGKYIDNTGVPGLIFSLFNKEDTSRYSNEQ